LTKSTKGGKIKIYYVKLRKERNMGLLSEIMKKHAKTETIEDSKVLKELEKAGESDADKIAEKMGQTAREKVSPRVDVSKLPPVEMPVQEKQEEQEASKGEAR